jgi:uncharacterized delta-60 repeat protein
LSCRAFRRALWTLAGLGPIAFAISAGFAHAPCAKQHKADRLALSPGTCLGSLGMLGATREGLATPADQLEVSMAPTRDSHCRPPHVRRSPTSPSLGAPLAGTMAAARTGVVRRPIVFVLVALAAFVVPLASATGALAGPGDLASGFSSDGSLSLRAYACTPSGFDAVLRQANGRILAVGSTWVPNGPACDPDTGPLRTDLLAARFNRNGSLDRSFGSGGIFTANLGLGVTGTVLDQPTPRAARAPHGRIIVAFGDRLVRLLPAGALDPSFGSNGIASLPSGDAQGVAVNHAGDPVVAETLTGPDASSFGVVRYLPDGSPDPSFGSGGIVAAHFGRADHAAAVAVDRQDRVVVAGSLRSGPAGSRNAEKLAVLRLSGHGTPDRTFGGNGVSTARFSRDAFANALAVLPSGKVLAVGRREPLAPKKPPVWALARFRSDGSADRTFSGNGVRTTEFGRVFTDDEQQAVAVSIQSDGKAIVAGIPAVTTAAGAGIGLARYLPRGGLDRSFGNGGKRWTGARRTGFACEDPRALSLLPQHRLVVGGIDACEEEDSSPPVATLVAYQR